jgi:TrpR-related protein YerC/YecD
MQKWRTNNTDELFNAFLKLGNTEEVASFCRDLMTEAEIEEFASRFQIAKLLYQGKSQRVIAKELGVSITTVTRVNQWLQRGEGGYKNVMDKIFAVKSDKK